jgi:hypothetical protein
MAYAGTVFACRAFGAGTLAYADDGYSLETHADFEHNVTTSPHRRNARDRSRDRHDAGRIGRYPQRVDTQSTAGVELAMSAPLRLAVARSRRHSARWTPTSYRWSPHSASRSMPNRRASEASARMRTAARASCDQRTTDAHAATSCWDPSRADTRAAGIPAGPTP